MANDVAKMILRHVESDKLSHLKKMYLSKHYRFNYLLGKVYKYKIDLQVKIT